MIAALTQRIEHLEALVAKQNAQIAEQAAELKEWRSGVRVRGRQRKRRRVRGTREAQEAEAKVEEVRSHPAGRKKGHKGAGRKKPQNIDKTEHRMLAACPDCHGPMTDDGVIHCHVVEDIIIRVPSSLNSSCAHSRIDGIGSSDNASERPRIQTGQDATDRSRQSRYPTSYATENIGKCGTRQLKYARMS